ncbi:MAG: hypothetical protein CFE24_12185 [Flavobacterium sp. BFFFF2]|nr:MAG: hypothetical protein CFE24_12185 [Flavobacterium sp. BFFFF2]
MSIKLFNQIFKHNELTFKSKNKEVNIFFRFSNYLFAKTKRRCIFATAKKGNTFLVFRAPQGVYNKEVFY